MKPKFCELLNGERNKKYFYQFLRDEDKLSTNAAEKKFLSDARIAYFYGMNVVFLFEKEKYENPLAFIAYKINNDRYLNLYFIYTAKEHRCKGYQKIIMEKLISQEIDNFDRIFSRASTIDSTIFYWKFGMKFHAIYNDPNTGSNELLVDTALSDEHSEPRKAFSFTLKHNIPEFGEINKAKMYNILLAKNIFNLSKSDLRKIKL